MAFIHQKIKQYVLLDKEKFIQVVWLTSWQKHYYRDLLYCNFLNFFSTYLQIKWCSKNNFGEN